MGEDLAARRALARRAYDEAIKELKYKFFDEYKGLVLTFPDDDRRHRKALRALRNNHRHDYGVLYAESAIRAGLTRPRSNKDMLYWRMARMRMEGKD